MSQRNSKFWTKARRARDQLIDRFIHHPDVSGVDIGSPPDRDAIPEEVVLRIHVRERWMKASPDQRLAFPKEVAGIPVVAIPGEYRLDTGAPELGQDRADSLPGLEPASMSYFQYLGKTKLTLIGPRTGRRYRFDCPGAVVAVDSRDGHALTAVSVLRQVSKPT